MASETLSKPLADVARQLLEAHLTLAQLPWGDFELEWSPHGDQLWHWFYYEGFEGEVKGKGTFVEAVRELELRFKADPGSGYGK